MSRHPSPKSACGGIACDVVIPFHNQLPFVSESIEGILNQTQAECFIHVVDDASTQDTAGLRARYAATPRVSWYRNDQNVGPYRSLHRVVPHLQTDFIAVQDADDIPKPQRIHTSVSALQSSKADVFAAAAQTFSGTPQHAGEIVRSRKPDGQGRALENSTMVVRRSCFCRLNGFADFFCGADTEFVLRAFYAKATFCVSDEVVAWKRLHPHSLTRSVCTGFDWPPEGPPNWISAYRQAVWKEVERRLPLFVVGDCDFEEFGCLDPELSRTIGCVSEPAPPGG